MGIFDCFKSEYTLNKEKADKIMSLDLSRYKCGYDERTDEQRRKDNKFVSEVIGKNYY